MLQEMNRMQAKSSDIKAKIRSVQGMDTYLDSLAETTVFGATLLQTFSCQIAEYKNHVLDSKVREIGQLTSYYVMEFIHSLERLDKASYKHKNLLSQRDSYRKKLFSERAVLREHTSKLNEAKNNLKVALVQRKEEEEGPTGKYLKDAVKEVYKCVKMQSQQKEFALKAVHKRLDLINRRIASYKLDQ